MSIDPGTLAITVVSSFLVPYVKMGVDKIAEKITEKMGDAAAKKASEVTQNVWNKVKAAFSGDDEAVLQNFEKYDGAGEDLLIEILKRKLADNLEFAQEIEQMINSPQGDSAESSSTGALIMKAHIAGVVDARNTNFANARNVQITGVSMSDANQKDKPSGDE